MGSGSSPSGSATLPWTNDLGKIANHDSKTSASKRMILYIFYMLVSISILLFLSHFLCVSLSIYLSILVSISPSLTHGVSLFHLSHSPPPLQLLKKVSFPLSKVDFFPFLWLLTIQIIYLIEIFTIKYWRRVILFNNEPQKYYQKYFMKGFIKFWFTCLKLIFTIKQTFCTLLSS